VEGKEREYAQMMHPWARVDPRQLARLRARTGPEI